MKINLEKELIKQNAKINTPSELLLIKEYEKLGEQGKEDLSRIGFTHLNDGKFIKERISKLRLETKDFDQSRVFHISQIKSIAEKYYLRFLPTHYYKGSVDPDLYLKIGSFEAVHNVEMKSKAVSDSYRNPYVNDVNNSFILAPKESFKLQDKPKDPLLFYMINQEYFYLVHKWGNDLSITRRIKSVLSNSVTTYVVWMLLVFSFLFLISNQLIVSGILSFIFGTIIYGGASMISHDFDDYEGGLSFYKKNKWNSPFND